LREHIDRSEPSYVYIFSSYVDNMCKYRGHPVYEDNCSLFKQMRNGDTAYRLSLRQEIPWRGFLAFDPEYRDMAFYLFQRREP
jgi:hypothetical protein